MTSQIKNNNIHALSDLRGISSFSFVFYLYFLFYYRQIETNDISTQNHKIFIGYQNLGALGVSFLVTIIISFVVYQHIENPTNKFGHKLC